MRGFWNFPGNRVKMASNEQEKRVALQTSTPFVRSSSVAALNQAAGLDGSLFEIDAPPAPPPKCSTVSCLETSLLEESTSVNTSNTNTQLNVGFINSTTSHSFSESASGESIVQSNVAPAAGEESSSVTISSEKSHLDAIIEEEEPTAMSETETHTAETETHAAETETHATETDAAETETHAAETDAAETKTHTAETEIHTAETETHTTATAAETETHTAETDTHAADAGTHSAETETHSAETETHTTEAETHTAETEICTTDETMETDADTGTGIKPEESKVSANKDSIYIEEKKKPQTKQMKRKRLTKAEQGTLEALASFGGSDFSTILQKNETFEDRLARDKEALEELEEDPPQRKKTRLELAKEEARIVFEDIPLGQKEIRAALPAPPTVNEDSSGRRLTRTEKARIEVLQSFGGSGFDDLFPKKKAVKETKEEEDEAPGNGTSDDDKKENKPVSETGLTS